MTARKTALRLLTELEEKDGFANLLLSETILARAGSEAAFLTALFYGTVERRLTLDYALGVLSGRSLSDIDPHVRRILHLGLYQLYFMSVPPHAAVTETVSLAEKRSERGFINAVLRAAVRAERALPLPSREKDVSRYLSVRHSVPRTTVRRLLSLFKEEETDSLLAFFNTEAPLSLTARDEQTRELLLRRYAEEGLAVRAARYAPRTLHIDTPVSPRALYGYDEGLFIVQDESSALSTVALGAREGDTVVDVCSAPGGKILGAALAAGGHGAFYAFDLHESKLSLIKSSAERLSLPVTVRALDATVGDGALDGCADAVIADVPCSGLGVLRKKPDLRYREITGELPALQYEILVRASRYVRAGGVLLYSTCTLLPEENGEVVSRFLREHSEFSLSPFTLGREDDPIKSDGTLTLLPHIHGTDGFFMARLVKKK